MHLPFTFVYPSILSLIFTNQPLPYPGQYPFTVDEETGKSLPLDKSFWDDLLDEALTWGLATYEQDWLDRQYMFTRLVNVQHMHAR